MIGWLAGCGHQEPVPMQCEYRRSTNDETTTTMGLSVSLKLVCEENLSVADVVAVHLVDSSVQ